MHGAWESQLTTLKPVEFAKEGGARGGRVGRPDAVATERLKEGGEELRRDFLKGYDVRLCVLYQLFYSLQAFCLIVRAPPEIEREELYSLRTITLPME